jgi:hypothetical protein
MAYTHHFCLILARGSGTSKYAFVRPPLRSECKTSICAYARVSAHPRRPAGGLGIHFCRPRCVSWHQLTVNAYPQSALGAPWRAPARTQNTCRATKTLTTHASMRGQVERRARTHFDAFGARHFVSPRHQTRREFHCQTRFRTTPPILRIFQKFQAHQTRRVLGM